MTERGPLRMLYVAAGASVAVGLVLCAWTIHELVASRARLSRLAADIGQLQSLRADMALTLAARDAFERLPARQPAPLEDVLRKALPEVRADLGQEEREDAGDGWVLRRREVVLGEVPFGRMAALVAEAEAGRPPWRLIKCTLRTSPGDAGTGQAVLLLEAAENTVAR